MNAHMSISVEVDRELEEKASAILARDGLTVADAVRLLLDQTVSADALPLKVFRPNAETIAAMREAERGEGKTFDTVEALMADLNADD